MNTTCGCWLHKGGMWFRLSFYPALQAADRALGPSLAALSQHFLQSEGRNAVPREQLGIWTWPQIAFPGNKYSPCCTAPTTWHSLPFFSLRWESSKKWKGKICDKAAKAVLWRKNIKCGDGLKICVFSLHKNSFFIKTKCQHFVFYDSGKWTPINASKMLQIQAKT